VRGIRHAEPVPGELVLLARRQQARRETRSVEQAPEVVARIREVGTCGGREAAGVDAAEENAQPVRQDVGYRLRQTALGSRAFRRCSNSCRKSSPESRPFPPLPVGTSLTTAGGAAGRASRRITRTVPSPLP